MPLEKATFAAGCFWGVEETFSRLSGVKSTAVGYMGGHLDNPTYEDVCTDKTGHAEVVQVDFDPSLVTYEQILKTFWESHDPTTLNRQGPDYGTQYRSVVFFHNPEQEVAAKKAKAQLEQSGRHKRAIVTAIVPASTFWRAEDYHQKYFKKHGRTCHF